MDDDDKRLIEEWREDPDQLVEYDKPISEDLAEELFASKAQAFGKGADVERTFCMAELAETGKLEDRS